MTKSIYLNLLVTFLDDGTPAIGDFRNSWCVDQGKPTQKQIDFFIQHVKETLEKDSETTIPSPK